MHFKKTDIKVLEAGLMEPWLFGSGPYPAGFQKTKESEK
jgi:hypothetical protein